MSTQAIAASENTATANRAGQMSPEQQQRLSRAIKAEASPGLIGAACFSFLFGIILWAGSRSAGSNMGWREYLLFGGLTVAGLLALGALLWRRSQRLQEVRAGRVEHATGHIVWESGAYRAHVPGHTLNLPEFNLGAGTYDFSFLPRSTRVVAAQLVARDKPAEAQDELRHALAVTNHFNVDDLPALRQGGLGRSGRRWLRKSWGEVAWLLFCGYLLAMIFAFMVGEHVGEAFAPFLIMAGVFLFLWGLGGAVLALIPTLDILRGQVASTRGQVAKTEIVTHGRYATTYHYYTLNNQRWLVSVEAYRALVQGPEYRIYYLPRSKQLIGIEPIE